MCNDGLEECLRNLLSLSIKAHNGSARSVEGCVDLIGRSGLQLDAVGRVIIGCDAVCSDIIVMMAVFASEVGASLAVSSAVEQHFIVPP